MVMMMGKGTGQKFLNLYTVKVRNSDSRKKAVWGWDVKLLIINKCFDGRLLGHPNVLVFFKII